jgi:hypothetical protein
MKKMKLFLVVLAMMASLVVFSQEELFYWPMCQSPQNIAPMQNAGGSKIWRRSSIVWNGKDYAVVWVDGADGRLHFRRFFADGTPASSATIPSTLSSYYYNSPKIVWNGSGYGVVWVATSGFFYQIYFLKLDQNGAPIGSEVKVSFVGIPETASCYDPDLAYSGNGYCVTWEDYRNANADIFATLLNNSGAITYSDTPISTATSNQYSPRIAWSNGIGKYQIVWFDYRSGKYEVYGSQISPSNVVTGNAQLVSGASDSYYPVLADMGNGLGMAWFDSRDGNWEIYFAKLSAEGYKIGTDLNITNNVSDQYNPAIVWTGAEFGVFWEDERTGNSETFFQRVSSSGTLLGSNTQVTYSGGMELPDAAFARYGYLATGTMYAGANYVLALGCNWDNTPPSCPESMMAYSITGTSATISWLPSVEDYTDIAYYILYRNNSEIAKTSDNYYADSGLSLNTTYKYDVRAVNAAGLTSTGCSSASMYLKTNATLTLMVNKNDPNAHLYWNDEGMNNYNVFRGTSPQQMTLIGSTSDLKIDDPNVLLDNVNYFYTVDDPGQ